MGFIYRCAVKAFLNKNIVLLLLLLLGLCAVRYLPQQLMLVFLNQRQTKVEETNALIQNRSQALSAARTCLEI